MASRICILRSSPRPPSLGGALTRQSRSSSGSPQAPRLRGRRLRAGASTSQILTLGRPFLEAYDTVSSSWVTLASLDGHTTIAATGTQIPVVSGNVITPDGSTATADRYIQRHELVGSRVAVSYTGGSGSSPVYLEITQNTEGYWTSVNDVRVPEMLASGLVGNVGTETGITFIPKRLTAVIHNVSTSYASWRLRIPAQSTKEGYFEIGSVVFGPFMAFRPAIRLGESPGDCSKCRAHHRCLRSSTSQTARSSSEDCRICMGRRSRSDGSLYWLPSYSR
jgi:hypothetical protein